MRGYLRLTVLCGLVAMSVFWGLACDEDREINDSPWSYAGIVTDSATGLPVDSARISEGDSISPSLEFFTDSVGFYRGVSFGGRITIFVQKADYLTQSRTLDLNRDLTDVDFRLVQE